LKRVAHATDALRADRISGLTRELCSRPWLFEMTLSFATKYRVGGTVHPMNFVFGSLEGVGE
jgi:hypothetical protein